MKCQTDIDDEIEQKGNQLVLQIASCNLHVHKDLERKSSEFSQSKVKKRSLKL